MNKARRYYKNEASKVREIKPQSENHEVGSEGAVENLLMKDNSGILKKGDKQMPFYRLSRQDVKLMLIKMNMVSYYYLLSLLSIIIKIPCFQS